MAPRRKDQPIAPQLNTAVQAYQEGETLQQRGERRKGQEAVTCFQQAIAKFQQALQQGLPDPQQQQEAVFCCAESLQLCAGAVMEAVDGLPDAQLSTQAVQQACARACELYAQATNSYQQVLNPGGQVRDDAAVNCGNALAAWAELLAAADSTPGDAAAAAAAARSQAAELYGRAKQMYEAALAQEEDALTYSNLGDTLIAQAEVMWDLGRPAEAETACQAGMQAYEKACSMSDSSSGDDLPGLLCNWATGLYTASKRIQDPAQRKAVLDQAAGRLQVSIDLNRADAEPLNTLGDILVALAELASSCGAAPQEVAGLYTQALEQGYGRALAINRSNTEGLLGSAEVHAAFAKLVAASGDAAAAAAHLQQSVAAYETALRSPISLGGFSDRCGNRYNYACVLARLGQEAAAAQLLGQLLTCGGISAAELAADEDLRPFHGTPWMMQLLGRSG